MEYVEMYRIVLQVKHLEVKLRRQEMPAQFTNFKARNIRQKRQNKITTYNFGINVGEILHHPLPQ